MPMNETELAQVVAELYRARQAEWPRLSRIRAHLLGLARDHLYIPKSAHLEYRLIVEMARFNILPRVVAAPAQNLYVDGYRSTSPSGLLDAEDSTIWREVWQANRMDARQGGLYRAALTYGAAYATVVPGELRDKPTPVVTPYSPLRCTALYRDRVNDEWPAYAVTFDDALAWTPAGSGAAPPLQALGPAGTTEPGRTVTVRVWDDKAVYTIDASLTGEIGKVTRVEAHGLDVCPVVRYSDVLDLDGHSFGKVEPIIHIQHQIDQTTFGLLMTQHYQAFKQRYVTGLAIELDEQGKPVAPWNAAVDAVWAAESPDTRFGEFGEVNLAAYLESRQAQIMFAAIVSQIPPHHLVVGNTVSNISSDALVALESAHRQDIVEHQTVFGEAHEQLLRLAGLAMGTPEGDAAWEDMSAQVVWRDMTPRTLAQQADALGKLSTQLEIPPRGLWPRIPGVTDQDIEWWTALAEERDPVKELELMLEVEKARPPAPAPGQVPAEAEDPAGDVAVVDPPT